MHLLSWFITIDMGYCFILSFNTSSRNLVFLSWAKIEITKAYFLLCLKIYQIKNLSWYTSMIWLNISLVIIFKIFTFYISNASFASFASFSTCCNILYWLLQAFFKFSILTIILWSCYFYQLYKAIEIICIDI